MGVACEGAALQRGNTCNILVLGVVWRQEFATSDAFYGFFYSLLLKVAAACLCQDLELN